MPNIAGKSKSLAAVHEMMSDLHRIGLVTHVASDPTVSTCAFATS